MSKVAVESIINQNYYNEFNEEEFESCLKVLVKFDKRLEYLPTALELKDKYSFFDENCKETCGIEDFYSLQSTFGEKEQNAFIQVCRFWNALNRAL